jgi:hypothetical protein
MSKFADAYIERLEKLRNAENTFYFDGDSIVLVPKDLENMNKLREFEAARIQGIESNLREKIASDIEKWSNENPNNSFKDGFNHALTLSAEIARG